MKRLHVFNSAHPEISSPEVSDLHLRATTAIEQIEAIIESAMPEKALPYWRDYELLHRFVYNRPPQPQRINRVILTALEKKIKGEAEIDKLQLFRAIHHCLYDLRDPAYFDKAMSWYHAEIQKSVDRQFFGKKYSQSNKEEEKNKTTDIAILLTPGIDLYPWLGSNAEIFLSRIDKRG